MTDLSAFANVNSKLLHMPGQIEALYNLEAERVRILKEEYPKLGTQEFINVLGRKIRGDSEAAFAVLNLAQNQINTAEENIGTSESSFAKDLEKQLNQILGA